MRTTRNNIEEQCRPYDISGMTIQSSVECVKQPIAERMFLCCSNRCIRTSCYAHTEMHTGFYGIFTLWWLPKLSTDIVRIFVQRKQYSFSFYIKFVAATMYRSCNSVMNGECCLLNTRILAQVLRVDLIIP